jgi:hypothetical protein
MSAASDRHAAQLTIQDIGDLIADSARVRFLAKRVAGGAPITSLCAWLGLRLRGRNLRPVSRDIGTSLWATADLSVGGQVMSVPAVV